ncbi:hypothetical protein [Psychroserpens sp. S379A]|uniref:hypothetical protein n=1 Tax=Psychroserpens sp. S379A TaxID=3415137 RepID=UPI003C7D454F
MNERITQAQKLKDITSDIKSELDAFKNNVKKLSWSEIVIIDETKNGASTNYQLTLPQSLINDFEKIKNKCDFDGRYKEIYHHLIFDHPDDSFDELNWHISTDNSSNRIHINRTGIPYSLRKLGLGKMIYKKIINHIGYISSENHRSYAHSDLLWNSLFNDSELYCFAFNNWLFATFRREISNEFFSRLNNSFLNLGDCQFDKYFCHEYANEITNYEAIKKHCTQQRV